MYAIQIGGLFILYPTFSSNSITLHKQLVLEGKWVSILPQFVVKKELKRGTLVDVFPSRKFN